MPGIFGGVGVPASCGAFLVREYERRWGKCTFLQGSNGFVGGHAFGGKPAVVPIGTVIVGLDGERSLYHMAATSLPDHPERIFRNRGIGIELTADLTGNVAVVDPEASTVDLVVDWTGTFPLYYGEFGDGIIFSSLMRPLADTIGAVVDPIGVLEFLREAYTVAGRTPYKGIKRLLPGQSLRFASEAGVRVFELSQAWVGRENMSLADAADDGWHRLIESVHRTASISREQVLMMSAGWDSRTLLAGYRASENANLRCYSHGDTASRELRIVERLCRSERVPCQLEPIDGSVLDLDLLRRAFDRTENVVFPHWHRAGILLSASGSDCVSAGIYGEVLGGHYGPAMLETGYRKIVVVAGLLLGVNTLPKNDLAGGIVARDYLYLRSMDRAWYLDPDFENAIVDRQAHLNADIAQAIDRLERRGVTDPIQIIEAFITEHRGTQYIAAQLLSCRAYTDVAIPFGLRGVFQFASLLPLQLKVHNRLNQAMLRRYAPTLLKHPLAATLVRAGAPIAVQEASRFARLLYAQTRRSLHAWTEGRVQPARLGWVNFGFLRTDQSLRAVVDDLKSDIWNRQALEYRLSSLEKGEWVDDPHPLYDQIMKIYTIDLLLR